MSEELLICGTLLEQDSLRKLVVRQIYFAGVPVWYNIQFLW